MKALEEKHLCMMIVAEIAIVAVMGFQLAQTPFVQAASQTPHDASVIGIINQVFGGNAGAARAVANCESGFNPGAYNPTPVGSSHAQGVFQILYPDTWAGTPYAGYSPYNAWANIMAAHAIFTRDGYSWREWACQP
jgi:hypothetical protein